MVCRSRLSDIFQLLVQHLCVCVNIMPTHQTHSNHTTTTTTQTCAHRTEHNQIINNSIIIRHKSHTNGHTYTHTHTKKAATARRTVAIYVCACMCVCVCARSSARVLMRPASRVISDPNGAAELVRSLGRLSVVLLLFVESRRRQRLAARPAFATASNGPGRTDRAGPGRRGADGRTDGVLIQETHPS